MAVPGLAGQKNRKNLGGRRRADFFMAIRRRAC
jgi:hypothetical protein